MSNCNLNSVGASFSAGDSGFVVVSASASGLGLINTMQGSVTVGLSQ